MIGKTALTRAAVRELDRRAIEEFGIPSFTLMESAGRAASDIAEELLNANDGVSGPAAERPVLVLIGPGNNGGDGLVVARTLTCRGHVARVFFLGERARLERCSDDVRKNAALWEGMGQTIESIDGEADPSFVEALGAAPLVVDALFGTGLDRPLRAPLDSLVDQVNAAQKTVLALDLPSGLDADSGHILGSAIRATVTVTFIAPKLGFALGDGPALCGRVVVAEIGIPPHLF